MLSSSSKVSVLQAGPYSPENEAQLQERFNMHRFFEAEDKSAFLTAHGSEIKAIATRGDLGADRALIEALPNLEIISVYGVGFDAVDLEAARENDVSVTNTPDVLTKDVADLGVAMMLAQARSVVKAKDWVKSSNWAEQGDFALQPRIHEKRVGILGMGRIGFEVGQRLAGFEMDIAYSDVSAKDHASHWTFIDDPVSLAKRSDFLFVTLAATAATRHIVNQDVINALGPNGMIINISRASTIDENALLDALEQGELGAAALDVFEGEPNINPRFLELDNVLLQPHHASGTFETRAAMGQLVFDNLVAHFDGQELLTPVL